MSSQSAIAASPRPTLPSHSEAIRQEFRNWPHFAEDEIEAVTAVLRSGRVNYWTGEECRKFEEEYAQSIGVKHAIALSNGTVALELALWALGVGPGDEVITSSRTFIASASCCVAVGAVPVCADVDPVSQNVTAETIRKAITPRTRAIIPVHLAGWPCDMDPILELAREHNLFVIEDCAQAHGATYKKRAVGSMGHMAAFSFCQDKIITTGGEGGLLVTNDTELWKSAWERKDHGKGFDTVFHRAHAPGFRWLHESFGTNFRMTEMQAAIGRLALHKLPEYTKRRHEHADTLNEALKDVSSVRLTLPPSDIGHAYYKYYAFVRLEALAWGWSRDRILSEISATGIPGLSGSCSEIYLEKAFAHAGLTNTICPVARELGETSIMFLVHPTISAKAQIAAAETIRSVSKAAQR